MEKVTELENIGERVSLEDMDKLSVISKKLALISNLAYVEYPLTDAARDGFGFLMQDLRDQVKEISEKRL